MWTDRINIWKQGSRWVVEFIWHESTCDVDLEFISYAKTKQEAQELAEEWFIEQAERLLYELGAWKDISRAPCPHCRKMVHWHFVTIHGNDGANRFEERAIIAPHFLPYQKLEVWRKSSLLHDGLVSDYVWECAECGGTIQ